MTTPDPRARSLLGDAVAARQRGDWSQERRLLDAAFRQDPADPQILNALGMCALADQDGAAAVRFFTDAASADAQEPALLMNLATAYRLLTDDDGERASLERVLAIDRRHFMGQLRLAQLNQRAGRTLHAAKGWHGVLQLAAAIDPIPPGLATMLNQGRAFLQDRAVTTGDALYDRLGGLLRGEGEHAVRMRACVEAVLGRRPIYHNVCEGLHYPFLPAVEFFERSYFPWIAELEQRTDVIRAELVQLLSDDSAAIRPYVDQEPGTPVNKWSTLDRSLDWGACFLWEFGVRNDEVCALCPETAAALEAVPQTQIGGKAPSAFFSILRPRAHIPAHTGVTNVRTIVHLPLIVPAGCRFRVGGQTRVWREGEAFAFDDTIEHEAWNDSDSLRAVLIFDVWNPYLRPDEIDFLGQLFDITEKLS